MADNFASHNPGVILVFCIVGVIALGIIFFQVGFVDCLSSDSVGAKASRTTKEGPRRYGVKIHCLFTDYGTLYDRCPDFCRINLIVFDVYHTQYLYATFSSIILSNYLVPVLLVDCLPALWACRL